MLQRLQFPLETGLACARHRPVDDHRKALRVAGTL